MLKPVARVVAAAAAAVVVVRGERGVDSLLLGKCESAPTATCHNYWARKYLRFGALSVSSNLTLVAR